MFYVPIYGSSSPKQTIWFSQTTQASLYHMLQLNAQPIRVCPLTLSVKLECSLQAVINPYNKHNTLLIFVLVFVEAV